jgi:hypothetical protein
MDPIYSLDCFDFNDDHSLDQQVDTIPAVERLISLRS